MATTENALQENSEGGKKTTDTLDVSATQEKIAELKDELAEESGVDPEKLKQADAKLRELEKTTTERVADGVAQKVDGVTTEQKPGEQKPAEDISFISKVIGWFTATEATLSGWAAKMTGKVREWLGLKTEESGVDSDADKDTDKDTNPETNTDLDLENLYDFGRNIPFAVPKEIKDSPVVAKLTSKFGLRKRPYNNPDGTKKDNHTGIDLGLPKDTPLVATKKVTIVKSWVDAGSGNITQFKDEDGFVYEYHHLAEPGHEAGTVINPGELIAKSGDTGFAKTGAHLHFMMKKEDEKNWSDPLPYFGENTLA